MKTVVYSLLFSFSLLYAQNFFPASQGDVWYYNGATVFDPYRTYSYSITKDSVSGHSIYLFYNNASTAKVKVDSLYVYGSIFSFAPYPSQSPLSDKKTFKKDALLGESWIAFTYSDKSYLKAVYTQIDTIPILGLDRTVKTVEYLKYDSTGTPYTMWPDYHKFADGLGIVEAVWNYAPDFPEMTLFGAVVNSDTVGYILSNKEIVKNLPNSVTLNQNYPNPFNPITNITFSLKKGSKIKLVISNILGRQVETVTSGFYNSGQHNITFNAQNLSSGTYFFSLYTEQKMLTKKMVVIK